jgi:hypothetical protein
MKLKAKLQFSLGLSIVLAVFGTIFFSKFNTLQGIEIVSAFFVSLPIFFGLLFVLLTLQEEIRGVNPFRDLFLLSTVSFVLGSFALASSVLNVKAVLSFLPIVALFLVVMVRSHYLTVISREGGRKQGLKMKDLSKSDKALIAIWFCGFFILLFLVYYYLGWVAA